jgi:hypothetical protein
MAEMLVSALRDMLRVCRRYGPPFIASITKSGGINLRLKQVRVRPSAAKAGIRCSA